MPFCTNCGCEIKGEARFCPECGAPQNPRPAGQNQGYGTGISCQRCGSFVPAGNAACPACGNPVVQDSHTTATVIGYLCAIFLPIVGIIIGIYLLTRQNRDVHKHGIIMIVLAIVLSVVYFLFFSYMSYLNSMRYYSYYY